MNLRKIFLLAVLIVGYHLTTFSQSMSQNQPDAANLKFGFNNSPKTLQLPDSIDFKRFLNYPPGHKFKLEPRSDDKDLHFGQLLNAKLQTPRAIDNMPCINPQGSFPTPVYKPDSAEKYTLLIKKY